MNNGFKYRLGTLLMICVGATIVSGQSAFFWVNTAPSAQSYAMAGANIADASEFDAASSNPAAIAGIIGKGSRSFSAGWHNMQVNISHSYLTYVRQIGSKGIGIELRHMDHGTFPGYDYDGNSEANYTAGDIFVRSTWATQMGDLLSVGISGGVITSNLANSRSWAALWSLGGTLQLPGINGSVAAVVQNRGGFIKYYGDSDDEAVPAIWLIGFSKKLSYLPLVLHLAGGQDMTNGDPLLRLGGEFSLGEAMKLRLGVDQDKLGYGRENYAEDLLSGISFGVGTQYSRNKPGRNMIMDLDGSMKFMGPLGVTLVFGLSAYY